eukprot:g7255.t2
MSERSMGYFTPETVRGYLLDHFAPERMVFVGVNVQHAELTKWVMRSFADYNAIPMKKREDTKATYTGGDMRMEGKSPYCHLALGLQSCAFGHAELAPVALIQELLGGGAAATSTIGSGVTSRLSTQVVKQSPFVESCMAFNTSYADSGLFGVYGVGQAEKVRRPSLTNFSGKHFMPFRSWHVPTELLAHVQAHAQALRANLLGFLLPFLRRRAAEMMDPNAAEEVLRLMEQHLAILPNETNGLFPSWIPSWKWKQLQRKLSLMSFSRLVNLCPCRNLPDIQNAMESSRLVLDSGSSTLAFCDSQFSQQAQYQSSDFISCNLYNPGGDFTGYWGPFVKGAVKVGNFTIPKAAYSIMQQEPQTYGDSSWFGMRSPQEKSMPCTDGLDGIFGIAFRQLDRAFRASDEYEMELSPEGKFTCPNQPAGVVPPPLVQHLRTIHSSTESAKIGLYWSGQQGEAQGRLYLGQSAVENEHYALADPLPAAHLGELGWYDISVQSITVGEQELEGLNCDPVHGETCILDTGTPAIVLPPEAYELLESSSGSLSFQLAGPNGPTTLSFDLQQLSNMGAISKGNKGDGLILGLPLWAFYYTVFDLDAHQVIFVPAYPPPSDPEVYPTEGPVWQPEPIQPTEPVIPFPGGGPWRPIPGGAGDIVGGPFGWPMGIFKENVTEPVQKGRVEESKAGGHRMLRGTVHI